MFQTLPMLGIYFFNNFEEFGQLEEYIQGNQVGGTEYILSGSAFGRYHSGQKWQLTSASPHNVLSNLSRLTYIVKAI